MFRRTVLLSILTSCFMYQLAGAIELHPVKLPPGTVRSPVEYVVTLDVKNGWDTLKYDDDTPAFYMTDANAIWAVRFSPGATCTVKAAISQCYDVNSVGTPCSLWVWDDDAGLPGNILAGPLVYTPAGYPTWDYMAIPGDIVIDAGDFHIGYWMPGGTEAQGQHALADAAGGERSNVNIGGIWYPMDKDLMIRAVISYSGLIRDIDVTSVSNTEGHFIPNSASVPISCNVLNGGDLTESNFDVICQVMTIAKATVYADTITVASLDPDESIDTLFTPDWKATADGDYIIRVTAELAGDTRPDNNQRDMEVHVVTSPGVLLYDDNSAENAWCWNTGGNGWAQRFDGLDYPLTIDTVYYRIWDATWPSPGGDQMQAAIYDDDGTAGAPGTELFNSGTVTINRGSWNAIPVTTKLQLEDGDFYVAYIQVGDNPNCPGLATDTDPPIAGQSWDYFDGEWTEEATSEEWMIRAFVTSIVFYDVGVKSINNPGPFVEPGIEVVPEATISNFGFYTADFDVVCQVDSPGTKDIVYADTIPIVGLDPGRDVVLPFYPAWVPGPAGTKYTLTVKTVFGSDQDSENDSLGMVVRSGFPGGDYLVWDPDPNHSSGPVIDSILSEVKSYAGDYTTLLGEYIDYLANYKSIFVCAGQNPNNYIIDASSPEAAALVEYLNSGGGLYIEGGDVWYWDPNNENGFDFDAYFGIISIGDGFPITQVTGIAGASTEGMDFVYSGEAGFSDIVSANGCVLAFKNQVNMYIGHYYSDTYKTFGFSGELAGLDDGASPSTKAELLDAIMLFLTGVEETVTLPREYKFTCYPNPARNSTWLMYVLPENTHVNIEVFDITGRLVKTIENAEKRLGTYSVRWDANDNKGHLVSAGVYFYKFSAGNFKTTKKVILLR